MLLLKWTTMVALDDAVHEDPSGAPGDARVTQRLHVDMMDAAAVEPC